MKLLSRDGPAALEEAVSPVDERLERLVADHRPFIRDIVARLTPAHLGVSPMEIEQESIIRLWRSLRNEREIRDFRSYVYRVVATAALDAIRQVKERREEQLVVEKVVDLSDNPVMPGSRTPSPEESVRFRDLLTRVRDFVAQLQFNRQRAVKLHLQGFTSYEIARAYGWSEPKARNLTYRGLDDLRTMLREARVEYEY